MASEGLTIFVFRKGVTLIQLRISTTYSLLRSHMAFFFPFSLPNEDRYLRSPFAGEEIWIRPVKVRSELSKDSQASAYSLLPLHLFAFTFNA